MVYANFSQSLRFFHLGKLSVDDHHLFWQFLIFLLIVELFWQNLNLSQTIECFWMEVLTVFSAILAVSILLRKI